MQTREPSQRRCASAPLSKHDRFWTMAVVQSRSSPGDKIAPAGARHKIAAAEIRSDDSKLAPAEFRPAEIGPAGARHEIGPDDSKLAPAGAKIRPAGAEIRPAGAKCGAKCGAGRSVLPKTKFKASNRIHSRFRARR